MIEFLIAAAAVVLWYMALYFFIFPMLDSFTERRGERLKKRRLDQELEAHKEAARDIAHETIDQMRALVRERERAARDDRLGRAG